MQNLILIGGGGHCKSCIDVIEQENKYKIFGILDMAEKVGQKVLGYKIIGSDSDILNYVKKGCSFLITVGQINSPQVRVNIFEKLKKHNAEIATIVSPRAYVSPFAYIGEGSIVMHDALVNTEAKVGENCIINTKVLLEHETVVSDNCHIAVGAVVAGGSEIGKNSFVGANSTIVQGVKVPENSFIKAGSLVK